MTFEVWRLVIIEVIIHLFIIIHGSYEECIENPVRGYSFGQRIYDLRVIKSTITCSNLNFNSEELEWQEKPEDIPYFLEITNSNITTVPASSITNFFFISKLFMSNLKIEKIEPGAFNGLAKLEELYLDENEITQILNGEFNGLFKLKILKLSKNKIMNISSLAFSGMTNLQEFYLEHNHITQIGGDIFNTNVNLILLNLSFNDITKISSSFKNNTSLKQLLLQNNQIEHINFEFFPQNIDKINLSQNKIKKIENWMILEKADITLDDNNVMEITPIGKNIKYLSINNNSLCQIMKVFNPVLEYLDVSYNNISKIASDAFTNASSLKSLKFNNNRINSLPNDCFKSLKNLEILNMSHNFIKNLQFGLFDNLIRLTFLDISYNNLDSLNEHVFHALSNLRELNFENNKIKNMNVSKLLTHFTSLKKINFNNNLLLCENLVKSKAILESKKIEIIFGHDFDVENVHGIPCIDDEKATPKNVIDVQNLPENISEIKLIIDSEFKENLNEAFLNSTLVHYFADEFRDTNFYNFLENLNENQCKTKCVQANFDAAFSKLNESLQNISGISETMVSHWNEDVANLQFEEIFTKIRQGFDSFNFTEFKTAINLTYKFFNEDFADSNFVKYLDSFKNYTRNDEPVKIGHAERLSFDSENCNKFKLDSITRNQHYLIILIIMLVIVNTGILILVVYYIFLKQKPQHDCNQSKERVELL